MARAFVPGRRITLILFACWCLCGGTERCLSGRGLNPRLKFLDSRLQLGEGLLLLHEDPHQDCLQRCRARRVDHRRQVELRGREQAVEGRAPLPV